LLLTVDEFRLTRRTAQSVPGREWLLGLNRTVTLPVMLLMMALTLSAIAAGNGVLAVDLAVTRLVQRLPGAEVGDLARLVNLLGSTPVMLALGAGGVVALMVRGYFGPAFFLLAAVLLRSVNPALKGLFDSPRPTADLVRVSEQSSGQGFPSAHTMGVMLFYGAIFLLARELVSRRGARLTIQAAAVGMMLATGFSRVYVGAHWPSDVVGAYLWGAVLLSVLAMGYRRGVPALARSAAAVLVNRERPAAIGEQVAE
jgi:undecaprenyl-diphosphatase